MKRILSLLLATLLLFAPTGCAMRPDDEQMDISQGYGEHIKLIHLNGSTQAKRERIRQVYDALWDCYALEREPDMFAYYPDFLVTVKGVGYQTEYEPVWETSAVVDINGEWVDILFINPPDDGYRFSDDKVQGKVFRSRLSAAEFKRLVHQS